jgi:hypothetical protein
MEEEGNFAGVKLFLSLSLSFFFFLMVRGSEITALSLLGSTVPLELYPSLMKLFLNAHVA